MPQDSTTRPRLLVLTSTFPASKSDHTPRFVQDLAQQLDIKFDITILTPHAQRLPMKQRFGRLRVERFRYLPHQLEQLTAGGGMPDRLRSNPLNYLAIPFFLVAQLVATCRMLRRLSPDAIHAHWWIPQGLSAVIATRLTRRNIPIVCTLHGADVFAFQGRLIRRLMIVVLRRCSRVCPVSPTIAREIPNSIRFKPSTKVAPMGVDIDTKFRPIPDVHPDHFSVLFVGRLAEKKGLQWLLTAFAVSSSREKRLRLVIVGDGVLKDKLLQQVEDLNIAHRVRFLGALPHSQLPKLYAKAGMAVVPSIHARGGDQEGFGLAAVEGLACGCPVIASNTPSLIDIVKHGENGIIVRQNDTEALANALCKLAQSQELQELFRSRARNSVTRFGWIEAAERYARIIMESIEERKT